MTWRHYLLLFILALAILTLVAVFEPSPGYMDADYYYAGGLQLNAGRGFTEPYLWNYLDDPIVIPHPSHAYWMPLASILVAAGAWFFGAGSWWAARAGFLLIAGLLPPLTAALAWSITSRRNLALMSGLLAVFPAFYLVFLPTTDTFGLYMLFGVLFLLVLFRKQSRINPFLLGLLAGLMHLTRADGLLWLLVALFSVFYIYPVPAAKRWIYTVSSILITLLGYLLIMLTWFLRNYAIFGTPIAPGGTKMLWITTYDQIFSYPASLLTLSAWLDSGIGAIVRVRTLALGLNLANAVSVQAEIILLPLVAVGFWGLRKDHRIQVGVVAWLLTLAAMTFAFPFAGARGGFFHSGAALQTLWWALAPVGLVRIIQWASQKRRWDAVQAEKFFQPAIVVLVVLITAAVFLTRVAGLAGNPTWSQEQAGYAQIKTFLDSKGMMPGDVVMVANPPGFYLASGNPAIALTNGGITSLDGAANQFNAKFVVLEENSTPSGLLQIFSHPIDQDNLRYLGTVVGAQIYAIQP
jgi:hypothetical protein